MFFVARCNGFRQAGRLVLGEVEFFRGLPDATAFTSAWVNAAESKSSSRRIVILNKGDFSIRDARPFQLLRHVIIVP